MRRQPPRALWNGSSAQVDDLHGRAHFDQGHKVFEGRGALALKLLIAIGVPGHGLLQFSSPMCLAGGTRRPGSPGSGHLPR
jgi:hypothetical protein